MAHWLLWAYLLEFRGTGVHLAVWGASLAFLAMVLVLDTVDGGPRQRPLWLTKSRTYPLLNATSAYVADFVAKRRQGVAMFGSDNASDVADNASGPVDMPTATPTPKPKPHKSRPERD